MHPIAVVVVSLVLMLPALYIAGEIKQSRHMRVGAFLLLFPLSVLVAWAVGMLQLFGYNARYGWASQSLIETTVQQLEGGNVEHVIRCLKELGEKYQPTYEHTADYDDLTEETVEQLKSKPISQANAGKGDASVPAVGSENIETLETEYVKPEGWTTLDVRGLFSLDVPPDTKEEPVQGVDSTVGKHRIGDIELMYDHGAYSSTLEEFSAYDGYARTEVTVDGWPAVLVTTNAGNMGVVFPKAPSGAKLTLHASYAGSESGDIAKKILLSVTFPNWPER